MRPGDEVTEAEALEFRWQEGFLEIRITMTDGVVQVLKLKPRSGEEVGL